VFKKYDLSGDGLLDFKEFSVMFTQKAEGAAAEVPAARQQVRQDPYLAEKSR
jgi:hypothetical protein